MLSCCFPPAPCALRQARPRLTWGAGPHVDGLAACAYQPGACAGRRPLRARRSNLSLTAAGILPSPSPGAGGGLVHTPAVAPRRRSSAPLLLVCWWPARPRRKPPGRPFRPQLHGLHGVHQPWEGGWAGPRPWRAPGLRHGCIRLLVRCACKAWNPLLASGSAMSLGGTLCTIASRQAAGGAAPAGSSPAPPAVWWTDSVLSQHAGEMRV